MPYSWPSEVLDLTQMVMDVRKQLKITVFIIPYNFCFINISKKAFLGLLLVWSQTLESEAAGPHPDGHGPFATILGSSVGQKLSVDTLTLSLVAKLTDLHIFSLLKL